jgi:hypothetical protein
MKNSYDIKDNSETREFDFAFGSGKSIYIASFILYCQEHGITQSMSAAGCPYDNAAMERYYNTFKVK